MPRLARMYIESQYLHIIVQGINKEYIFKGIEAKERYKATLKKNLLDTEVKVLAYCIMDNHIHILLYSEKIEEITKLMQKTNTSYAKWYNKQNKRVGYVFRDRYFSQMIMNEQQLLNCIAYIHNNPVVANMVNNVSEYKYSSFKEFYGKKDLITKDGIELVFGSVKNCIDCFKIIHKNKCIDDIMEIKDDVKSSDKIIQEFMVVYKKDLKAIIKDEKLFYDLLLQLRHKGDLSLREMSKILGVNKDKLGRIINKNL